MGRRPRRGCAHGDVAVQLVCEGHGPQAWPSVGSPDLVCMCMLMLPIRTGAVVFDEFHERNLDADVALALCADVQRLARPDLRCGAVLGRCGAGRRWQLGPSLGTPGEDSATCPERLSGEKHEPMETDVPCLPALPLSCRLVVMSATLGGGLGDRVQQLLAEAAGPEAGEQEEGAEAGSNRGVPLVVSEGRCYPVTTKHLGRPDGERDWEHGCAVRKVP